MLTALLIGGAGVLVADDTVDTAVKPSRALPTFGAMIRAVGTRFATTGQERWQSTVTVTNAQTGATSNVTVTVQWPLWLRIDSGARNYLFTPGHLPVTAVPEDLRALAEVILEDGPDGVAGSQLGTTAVRVIGRGYPDPLNSGHRVDAVAVSFVPRTYAATDAIRKQFRFDSETHLVSSVVSSATGAETRFEQWSVVNGNAFPATVTHYLNGTLVRTISFGTPTVSARVQDSLFREN